MRTRCARASVYYKLQLEAHSSSSRLCWSLAFSVCSREPALASTSADQYPASYKLWLVALSRFGLCILAWTRRSNEALRAPSPVGSQYSVSERGFVRVHARRREKARSMIEASARAPRVYCRCHGGHAEQASSPEWCPAPAAFRDCPSPGLGKPGRATVRCAHPTETGEEEGARVLLASDTDNPRDDFRD